VQLLLGREVELLQLGLGMALLLVVVGMEQVAKVQGDMGLVAEVQEDVGLVVVHRKLQPTQSLFVENFLFVFLFVFIYLIQNFELKKSQLYNSN